MARIVGKEMSAELMPLVNKLTNWQRNQWAKAGYPIEPEIIQRFLNLKK